MSKLILPLFLLISILHISATDFIKSSCRTTRYPALCVECLSMYSNTIQRSPRQLAQTALSVSLARARSVTAFVSKLIKAKGMNAREYQAVKDCVDNMSDSVDRLNRSVREMGHMGQVRGEGFMWHMSNVQTWVSAALTDENTCVDGLDGHVMKASIRGRVVNVAQVTSNALGLVNQFAARHQAIASTIVKA